MRGKIDNLDFEIYDSRTQMGESVAKDVCEAIYAVLKKKDAVNIIFAAAPSQMDLYKSLLKLDIPWSKVNAFHMDEYVGISEDKPQSFRNYLKSNLFEKIPLKSIHYIKGDDLDVSAECDRYSDLLIQNKVDIVCMGIGENTHIAFNDPPVADFQDPLLIKKVELDLVCRQQQVNDGCFESLDMVPTHALTLTIPSLLAADYLFCVVPNDTKAQAVYYTLNADISELYPSTILRRHGQAKLYLDQNSSSLLVN